MLSVHEMFYRDREDSGDAGPSPLKTFCGPFSTNLVSLFRIQGKNLNLGAIPAGARALCMSFSI